MRFFGSAKTKLDEKNRLRIPAKYAGVLTENPLVMRGTQHCLFIMTSEDMEKTFEKIFNAPISDFSAQNTLRLLNSGTEEIEADAQMRFVLKPEFKRFAGIDKNIVLLGAGNRIEIWSEEAYEKQFAVYDDEVDAAILSQSDKFDNGIRS